MKKKKKKVFLFQFQSSAFIRVGNGKHSFPTFTSANSIDTIMASVIQVFCPFHNLFTIKYKARPQNFRSLGNMFYRRRGKT